MSHIRKYLKESVSPQTHIPRSPNKSRIGLLCPVTNNI
jgi:hypothetical protein